MYPKFSSDVAVLSYDCYAALLATVTDKQLNKMLQLKQCTADPRMKISWILWSIHSILLIKHQIAAAVASRRFIS